MFIPSISGCYAFSHYSHIHCKQNVSDENLSYFNMQNWKKASKLLLCAFYFALWNILKQLKVDLCLINWNWISLQFVRSSFRKKPSTKLNSIPLKRIKDKKNEVIRHLRNRQSNHKCQFVPHLIHNKRCSISNECHLSRLCVSMCLFHNICVFFLQLLHMF